MSAFDSALATLIELDGALGVAIVDTSSGMVLAHAGDGIDLESAAAATTELVRAQARAIRILGASDEIDDILVTLSTQHQIIRPLRMNPEFFLYIVLDRTRSRLPLARLRAQDVDAQLS